MKRRSGISMVFAAVALLGSCRSNKEESRQPVVSEKAQPVTLDLRFTAPTGYEFCAGKSSRGDPADPQKLPHKDLDLTIRLPSKIELPPDAYGAKEIVFRPGRHDVDVYKHLDSGRLIATHGMITMDTPTLRVKLDMSQWPPGRYVIGISGDPFFGYCTMDFE